MKVDKTKWEKVRFDKVGSIELGKTLNSKTDKGEECPYLCSVNVGMGVVDLTTIKQCKIPLQEQERYSLRRGDLLVCEGGDAGRCAIWNFDIPMFYQNALHRVRVNDSFLNKYVLYYLLFLKRTGIIDRKSVGVTIKHFTKKAITSLVIPSPSFPEQQAIAAELDALQSVIDKLQEQLNDYDKLAQSIFHKMFGEGIHERKWQVKRIGDIAQSVNYGTSSPANEDGKYIYLRMGNITDEGYLDLSDIKHIYISDEDKEKYLVEKGDILFNRTNSRDKVGKTTCFWEDESMVIAGYIIRVRLKSEAIPIYIWRYMNTPAMKRHLRTIARGSVGQANINSKELCSIPVSLPPLPLQRQFAEQVEAIEAQKTLVRQQIADARQLFDSRMQYYFE